MVKPTEYELVTKRKEKDIENINSTRTVQRWYAKFK